MNSDKKDTSNSKRKRLRSELEETGSTSSEPTSSKKICDIENYLKFGFRIINNQPQCVICYNIISNKTEIGMLQHLKISHPQFHKNRLFNFQEKLYILEHKTEEEISKLKSLWHRYTVIQKYPYHKYSSYIRYGCRDLSNGYLHCLLCLRVFFPEANDSKVLQGHLKLKHPKEKDETLDFFIEKYLMVAESEEVISEVETTEEVFIHQKELHFIQYGFRPLTKGNFCILCCKMFSVDYKKQSKMKQHLRGIHAYASDKPLEFFLKKIFEIVDKPELQDFIEYPMKEDDYLKFGFRIFGESIQCVLCYQYMKPSLTHMDTILRNHLQTQHPESKDQPIEYFQEKRLQLEIPLNEQHIELFLKHGYRIVNSKPQCIFCLEFVSLDNLKPDKLNCHLAFAHPYVIEKPIKFFQDRLAQLELEPDRVHQAIDHIEPDQDHSFDIKLKNNSLRYGFRVLDKLYQCLMCFRTLASANSKHGFLRHYKSMHPTIKVPAEDFFKQRLLSIDIKKESHTQNNSLDFRTVENVLRCIDYPETQNNVTCEENHNVIYCEQSTNNNSQIDLHNTQNGILNDKETRKIPNSGIGTLTIQTNDLVSEVSATETVEIVDSEIETEDVKIEQIIDIQSEPSEVQSLMIKKEANNINSTSISDERSHLKTMLKDTEIFSLQIDAPTFEGIPYLLTYIRFVSDNDIEEKLLFCKALIADNILVTFLSSVEPYALDWNKCITIYTDCSNSELNKDSYFVRRLKEVAVKAQWHHGLIDLYSFVRNKLTKDLMLVLNDAINIINLIKSSTSRFASVLSGKSGVYRQMLLHETRWLSRGRVLNLLVELNREVSVFLTNQKSKLGYVFFNPKWMMKLAYLSDIFSHLNDLVVSTEGKEKNVIIVQKTIQAFIKKLTIWISRLQNNEFDVFPVLWNLVEVENYKSYFIKMKFLFIDHLYQVKNQLEENFPPVLEASWIFLPFSINFLKIKYLSQDILNQLKEISADVSLMRTVHRKNIALFWISLRKKYPKLVITALEQLVPFSSSCLCELGFSSLMELKIEGGSGMDLERELMLNMNSSIVQML